MEHVDAALRKYATHLTSALALAVAITGVMMFYRFYKGKVSIMHEWMGMAFLIAIALHLFRNRWLFIQLLAKRRTQFLLVAVAIVEGVFISQVPPEKSNPGKLATQALLNAPLGKAASVFGLTDEEAVSRLKAVGVATATSNSSINAMARSSKLDSVLLLNALTGEERK